MEKDESQDAPNTATSSSFSTADVGSVVQNVMQELEALAGSAKSAATTAAATERQEDSVDNGEAAVATNIAVEDEEVVLDAWDWLPASTRASLEVKKDETSIPKHSTSASTSSSTPHVNENELESEDDDMLSSEEGDEIGELLSPPPPPRKSAMISDASCASASPSSSPSFLSGKIHPTNISSSTTNVATTDNDMDTSLRSYVPEDASYPKTRAFEKSVSSKHTSLIDGDEFEKTTRFNFLNDDPSDMTRARRLAKRLMEKRWYNPHAGKSIPDLDFYGNHGNGSRDSSNKGNNNNGDPLDTSSRHSMRAGSIRRIVPSLERAWAYFEHVTLTRYIPHEENVDTANLNVWQRYRYSFTRADEEFERAQPGEKRMRTRLYDWISTPHKQLGDFGLGFGLYFSTLRAIRNILLIAGLISVFNIYFFASEDYDSSGFEVAWLMKGSAVCTQTEWVPCLDCNCTSSNQGWDRTERCREEGNVTFVVKNQCLEDDHSNLWILGLTNYAVLIFLVIAVYFALDRHLDKETVIFDEDEQTAMDYSILIKNPPQNANNPEEWRDYFESNFEGVKVVAVSCNVNNDLLIKSLVRRRETLRRMELQLDHGALMDIDNLALLAAQEAQNRSKYFGAIKGFFLPGLPELLSNLVALNTSIKGLTQLSYPCTNVYVTFEMERHQRLILSKLSVGLRYVKNNDASILEDPKLAFQERVLHVMEPSEPNSVRWQDLNASKSEKSKESILTTALSFASIYVCALIVTYADSVSPGFGAAFTISGLNLGYPLLAKFITDFESHRNESKVQTSLYVKIACFRWVNTAIVITVITPFTQTLTPSPGLISQIAAIFFAEIVTTNVIQLTDVWGHIQRHFLAPRAKTQDAMNRWFKGLEVELAERYTNMTKIMFLAFWYSSIFPGGLLFAAIALTVNYYTDRFSLMRSWQRAPSVGKEIAVFSRHYFLSSACVILAMMSSFYWSAFPFDNLCPTEASVNTTQIGNYTFENESVSVDTSSNVYRFCNQDFILRPGGPDFPFIFREGRPGFGEWMSDEQKFLSLLFGWTSVGVLGLVVMKFLYGIGIKVRKQFVINYEADADDQGIGFHDVRNIAGYVPQVRSSMFSYPLIVCPTKRLGDELFDWTDPDLDYEYYDLTKDADHVLTGSSRPGKNSFDRVMYWSPGDSDSNAVNDLKQQKRRIEEKVARNRRSQNIFNTVSVRRIMSDDPTDATPANVCVKCGTPYSTANDDDSTTKSR